MTVPVRPNTEETLPPAAAHLAFHDASEVRTNPFDAPERILRFWKLPVPTTSSFEVGLLVPIPIFPVERVVLVPLIPIPKRRFPILRVLDDVAHGASISYPMTILLFPVRTASATFAQRKRLLLEVPVPPRPDRYPRPTLLFPLTI